MSIIFLLLGIVLVFVGVLGVGIGAIVLPLVILLTLAFGPVALSYALGKKRGGNK